jgi:hypothetical protein
MSYPRYNCKPFRRKQSQLYTDLDMDVDTKVLYVVYY